MRVGVRIRLTLVDVVPLAYYYYYYHHYYYYYYYYNSPL